MTREHRRCTAGRVHRAGHGRLPRSGAAAAVERPAALRGCFTSNPHPHFHPVAVSCIAVYTLPHTAHSKSASGAHDPSPVWSLHPLRVSVHCYRVSQFILYPPPRWNTPQALWPLRARGSLRLLLIHQPPAPSPRPCADPIAARSGWECKSSHPTRRPLSPIDGARGRGEGGKAASPPFLRAESAAARLWPALLCTAEHSRDSKAALLWLATSGSGCRQQPQVLAQKGARQPGGPDEELAALAAGSPGTASRT
jgi:hypothetical protein